MRGLVIMFSETAWQELRAREDQYQKLFSGERTVILGRLEERIPL